MATLSLHARLYALALLFALALVRPAHAQQVIYDNGPLKTGGGNEMTAWIQAEDVTLSVAATVTHVRFWDLEYNGSLYNGSIAWQIYADNGGKPGSILYSGEATSVTRASAGSDSSYRYFQNDFDIAPAALPAGKYYLGLHNGSLTTTSRDNIYWATTGSNATPSGIENQTPFADNSFVGNGQEHAFALYGTTGPLAVGVSDPLATPHALLTGTVYLDTPAPAGGKTVTLGSDGPAATVPASVVVPEGATSATFPIMTQSLASANKADTPTLVTLTASDGVNRSTANFTVTPAAFARADTFVQDGPNADTNFGSAQTLLVSTDASDGTGGNADTYVKMRFNRFHSIRRAWLRVYASVPNGGSAGVTLYAVPDTTWSQDTLTFNTRPALGSVLKSVTIAGASVVKYDIDVTQLLQTSLAANKTTVGLALHGPNAPTPLVDILSKETQDLKPQLIILGN